MFAARDRVSAEALLSSTLIGRSILARAGGIAEAKGARDAAAAEERELRRAEARGLSGDAAVEAAAEAVAQAGGARSLALAAAAAGGEGRCVCPWCARFAGTQRNMGIDVDLAFNPQELCLY